MRRFRVTLLSAGLALAAFPVQAQEALSPAVGKPLASAKALMAAHNYAKAMAQVRVADAVRGKTAYESFVIEQMRGSIAQASGDVATAARTYQALIDSGRVPAGEQLKLLMAEASMAYTQKNYAGVVSWTERYLKAGGNDPAMRSLLISGYYLQGNFAVAAKLQAAQVAALTRAGQKPTENQLQLLYTCQTKINDGNGALATMSQLVLNYPKPEYWLNVIDSLRRKPGYNDRLNLDVNKLEFALGLLKTPSDVMEMIELELQVPLPGDAKDVTDKAFAAGILGTGAEAARHQRLRDLVNKTYTEDQKTLGKDDADAATDHDGNRLAALGEEYVSYGNVAKGIPMIIQGIRKGGLRHAEDTKLHLALAFLKAGDKPKAIAELKAVGGTEGAADLAHLWLLFIARNA